MLFYWALREKSLYRYLLIRYSNEKGKEHPLITKRSTQIVVTCFGRGPLDWETQIHKKMYSEGHTTIINRRCSGSTQIALLWKRQKEAAEKTRPIVALSLSTRWWHTLCHRHHQMPDGVTPIHTSLCGVKPALIHAPWGLWGSKIKNSNRAERDG